MHIISIKVAGDIWCNPQEVEQRLCEIPRDQPISLDLRMEGPSLEALGILDMVRAHCARRGRDPTTITLERAPNTVEHTEFRNTHVGLSHFFARSTAYQQGSIVASATAARMALFVGRATVSRACIMHELVRDYEPGSWLFSVMQYHGAPWWEPYAGWQVCEQFDHWASEDQQAQIQHWWQHSRPLSLDNMAIQDQYRGPPVTNASLLQHYPGFHIELVLETYTLGASFFPTEKTVRPITAAKPWMIYAAPNFIAHLQDLGFKSYHELWDEGYDQYQGVTRWQHMRRSIDHVYSLSAADFLAMMQQAQRISHYNQRRLAEISGRVP